MSWNRVVILCEDRAHLDFLRGICRARGWTVVDEDVAPKGRDAASAYVIRRLPTHLAAVRSGYTRLGLLVAVDGDNVGPAGRLGQCARVCLDVDCAPREGQDPAVLLIPTWSIDTWGLLFCKGKALGEKASVKHKARSLFRPPHRGFRAPGVPTEDAPRVWKPTHLHVLLTGFLSDQSHPDHPSVDLARADLARWS